MPKVDNYIKFLNAFYAWEQQNPLTPIQECILMRILRRVNTSGWSEWIRVSNLELMLEMHMTSEITFRNNRNRLIELGLIEYKAGKKGKPSSYKINMPMKKEIVYKFGKNKHVENNTENINLKNKGDKINVKTNVNINVKSNVNNPENPHQHCVTEAPKHKTINNKLKNKLNNKLFNLQKSESQNKSDVLSDKPKYDDVLSLYNTVCLELSKVLKLSAKRKKQIDKMLSLGYTLEDFKKVFENTQKSSFLCGKSGNRSWKANFDWLIKEDNFLKVLEGNYQDLVKENAEIKQKIDNSTDINDWI